MTVLLLRRAAVFKPYFLKSFPIMNTQNFSDSVKKVHDYLSAHQVECEFRTLAENTRTAQMAADVLGISAAQIASSLIFADEATGELVLIVTSGGHRVDLDKVKASTGRSLIKAAGKEIKNQTGYAIGGVPPVAHATPLVTYLDRALLQFDTVWAAGGSPFAVFGIAPAKLEALTGGEWLDVAD